MADAIAAGATAPLFNFKQAISQMVQRNGSTCCSGVGRHLTVRLNGELTALEMQLLKPEDLKLLAEQIMTPRQVKEFAERRRRTLRSGAGVGRFRTNIYQQRGTLAFAFRAIPYEVKTVRELALPPVLEEISMRARA
jgi:twitching motility protein PilT